MRAVNPAVQNRMVIEDVDDYDQAVSSGQTDGASSLLTSWNAPTQNAA